MLKAFFYQPFVIHFFLGDPAPNVAGAVLGNR